jgi:hypothetical protein
MKQIVKKTFKGLFYLEHMGHHTGNLITLAFFLLFLLISTTDIYHSKWLFWLTFLPIPIGHLYGAYKRTIEDEQLDLYLKQKRKENEEFFKRLHHYQSNKNSLN